MIQGLELLLRTDSRGRVLAIDEASPVLRSRLRVGGSLAPLLAEESAPAGLDFLFGLHRNGAALAWDLALAGRPAPPEAAPALHLLGIEAGAGCLVAGSHDRGSLLAFARRLATPDEGRSPGELPVTLRPEPDDVARTYLAGLCQASEWEQALLEPDLARENAELRHRLATHEEELARLRARLAELEP